MAMIWIEGFEELGTTLNSAPSPTGVMARKYQYVGNEANMTIVSGRYAGLALNLPVDTCYFGPGTMVTTTGVVMGVGCAVKFSGLANYQFLTFYGGTSVYCNIRLTSGGELAVYNGSGTLLGTTTTAKIVAGQWYHIEFNIGVSTSTGSVYVRVDGVEKLALTNKNTQAPNSNAYVQNFRFTGSTATPLIVDDVYCYDHDTTVYNRPYPQGVRQVVTLFPTGAGSSTQWTASAGSNYACVNEQVADDDTTYVSPSNTSQQDLYTVGSLSGLITGTPLAVQVNTDVRVTTGSATLYHLCSTNTSSWPLGGRCSQGSISGTTYGTYRTVWECNPANDVSWTTTTVSSTTYGVRS